MVQVNEEEGELVKQESLDFDHLVSADGEWTLSIWRTTVTGICVF